MQDNSKNKTISKYNLVTHFIAGYPDIESSFNAAKGMIEGGAFALEMQIPFSDPCADGPIIESACRVALDSGINTAKSLKLLQRIRSKTDIPLFVMCYANQAFIPGLENFVHYAKIAGANGVIIPDLVPGNDEGLFKIASDAGCPAVPVMVPGISQERMDSIVSEPVEWVYAALRSGITGHYTELGNQQQNFLKKLQALKNKFNFNIMAGFGIREFKQVKSISEYADAAIVGSALVQAITNSEKNKIFSTVSNAVKSLMK